MIVGEFFVIVEAKSLGLSVFHLLRCQIPEATDLGGPATVLGTDTGVGSLTVRAVILARVGRWGCNISAIKFTCCHGSNMRAKLMDVSKVEGF